MKNHLNGNPKTLILWNNQSMAPKKTIPLGNQ